MANFKEIVTKAVIGKGKKTFVTTNTVTPNCPANTILGCWIINHNFKGFQEGDNIIVEGKYDINIWYACEKDTRTEVTTKTDTYREVVIVPRRNNTDITGNEEIIVRSLKQPTCTKADIVNNNIEYTIEKDLGIEIVGDTKVRIAIDDNEDDWDIIEDPIKEEELDQTIDQEVKEDFL